MYRLEEEVTESNPAEKDSGILENKNLGMSQQCALAAPKVNCYLGCITRGVASRAREVDAPLCSAPLWLHLEYWGSQYKKDAG